MTLRMIKVLLALMLALLAIAYATQNVVNIEQAHAAVSYVLGRVDHAVYPNSFMPAISEYLAGLVLLKGAFDLFRARGEGAMAFDQSKKFVYVGAGIGMLVWFGLFHVIGGAIFQQWQTEAGDGSLSGAFWFGAMMALTSLFIAVTPDE
jgi:predicted small integral membrane protein